MIVPFSICLITYIILLRKLSKNLDLQPIFCYEVKSVNKINTYCEQCC